MNALKRWRKKNKMREVGGLPYGDNREGGCGTMWTTCPLEIS